MVEVPQASVLGPAEAEEGPFPMSVLQTLCERMGAPDLLRFADPMSVQQMLCERIPAPDLLRFAEAVETQADVSAMSGCDEASFRSPFGPDSAFGEPQALGDYLVAYSNRTLAPMIPSDSSCATIQLGCPVDFRIVVMAPKDQKEEYPLALVSLSPVFHTSFLRAPGAKILSEKKQKRMQTQILSDVLREAARVISDYPDLYHALFDVIMPHYMKEGRFDVAEEVCRAGLRYHALPMFGPGGDQQYMKALGPAAPPGSPVRCRLWFVLGQCLEAQAAYGSAARAYEAAAKQIPRTKPPAHVGPVFPGFMPLCDVLNAQGLALKRAGDCAGARRAYTQAARAAPPGDPIHEALRINLRLLKQQEDAIRQVRRRHGPGAVVGVHVPEETRKGIATHIRESQEDPGAQLLSMCGYCGGWFPKVWRCKKCQARTYCSAACQKDDWKAGHKKECRPLGQTSV